MQAPLLCVFACVFVIVECYFKHLSNWLAVSCICLCFKNFYGLLSLFLSQARGHNLYRRKRRCTQSGTRVLTRISTPGGSFRCVCVSVCIVYVSLSICLYEYVCVWEFVSVFECLLRFCMYNVCYLLDHNFVLCFYILFLNSFFSYFHFVIYNN